MWFFNKIELNQKIDIQKLIIEELNNKLKENKEIINNHTTDIEGLKACHRVLLDDFGEYREENNIRMRQLNNLINEKLDFQKEHNEAQLIGLQKAYNLKLDNLSEGKPLVQDLLKKIAHLEGISQSTLNRVKTEDIMNKLSELNDLMLRTEREEKNTDFIKEQVNLLKWILGEKC